MIGKALALLVVAGAALVVFELLLVSPVAAQTPRATRSFAAPSVVPGGRLEVRITAAGYGPFGRVVETLPAGFRYSGSSLSEDAVEVEGRTVSFILFGIDRFSYTVNAPNQKGSHTFSGVLTDAQKVDRPVTGSSRIRVGPDATPHTDAHCHANAGAHSHADATVDPRSAAHCCARGGAHAHSGAYTSASGTG